ncbi:hypothetical protein HN011_007896, partial [Eciton burchellii]
KKSAYRSRVFDIKEIQQIFEKKNLQHIVIYVSIKFRNSSFHCDVVKEKQQYSRVPIKHHPQDSCQARGACQWTDPSKLRFMIQPTNHISNTIRQHNTLSFMNTAKLIKQTAEILMSYDIC